MADGSARDEIAAALHGVETRVLATRPGEAPGWWYGPLDRIGAEKLLSALLPVVERLQRQASARALRDAADELDDAMVGEGIRRRLIAPSVGVVADRLRARADGIEAT